MRVVITTEQAAAVGGEIRTFLIADIRGYTTFTVLNGDAAAARLTSLFAEMMQEVAASTGGELLELRGDEALITFASARQALRAAIAAQGRCAQHSSLDPAMPIRIGIGIDAGEAIPMLGGFRGKALNLAARLCSLAGVGEILISEVLAHLAGHLDDVEYEERGEVQVKGFSEPVPVIGVRAAGAAPAAVAAAVAEPVAAGAAPAIQPAPEGQLPIGAYLGALPSTPLVAREEETLRLSRILSEVVAGEGRVLLLAGEPGAGKTRLAQEAFLRARNQGLLLGVGSCLENRQTVPYYPFLDALPGLVLAARAGGAPDPFSRWPQLRRLIGEAGEPALEAGAVGHAEEERLRREVGSFLMDLARSRPVALFLDDLHWADESTLELLHHLARQAHGDRLLLVGIYRDVEVGRQHRLEGILRELRRQELVQTIAVRGLPEAGTAALLAAGLGEAEVSAEFADLVHRQTDGNPFFIQQVLRALVERGDVYREGDRWQRREMAEIELPESIRSTIGERVSRLSASAQEVLASASVLGQSFEFEDLREVAGIDEVALEQVLGEAIGVGLVRTSDGETHSFDHALTHHTLVAEIPARRRRRLHAAAAAAISNRPGAEARAAEIARHYLEADDPPHASRWSLLAAERARRLYAHREAERHYSVAAEMAVACGDPNLEAAADVGVGEARVALGHFGDALQALEKAALHFREAGEVDAEATVLAEVGRVYRDQANSSVGIERLREFLDRVPESEIGPEPLAQVLASISRLYWLAGRTAEMDESAERAAELATAAGNTAVRVQADVVRAHTLTERGDLAGALKLIRVAVADAERFGGLIDRVTLMNNLAFTHCLLGDFEQNLEWRRRALELALEFAQAKSICFAQTMVAQALTYLGDLEAAETHLALAAEAVAGQPPSRAENYLKSQTAHVLLMRGDVAAAERLLPDLDQPFEFDDVQLHMWMGTLAGEIRLWEGRPEEALEVLAPQAGICRSRGRLQHWVLPLHALALLDSGDPGGAHASIQETVAAARAQSGKAVLMDALRVLGSTESALGNWEAADRALAEAEELALGAPYPYGVAWARLERARSLAARGEAAAASAQAAAALAEADRIGATRVAETARKYL